MAPVGFEPKISAGERPLAAHLLITRPGESYRLWCVVCDLETSTIGVPYIYIYIYDISSLRVKDNAAIGRVIYL